MLINPTQLALVLALFRRRRFGPSTQAPEGWIISALYIIFYSHSHLPQYRPLQFHSLQSRTPSQLGSPIAFGCQLSLSFYENHNASPLVICRSPQVEDMTGICAYLVVTILSSARCFFFFGATVDSSEQRSCDESCLSPSTLPPTVVVFFKALLN